MSVHNLGIPQISYNNNMEPILTYLPIRRAKLEDGPASIEIKKATPLPFTQGYKNVGMIGSRGATEIILCLPIAKWYSDWGYQVIWPVESEFLSLFDYVPYVKPVDLGTDKQRYTAVLDILFKVGAKKIIDLGIGYSREEDLGDLHFDELKYKDAGVKFEERFNLSVNRDRRKEAKLLQIVMKKHGINDQSYKVAHSDSSYDWKIQDAVQIEPIEGYTIFDWISIIENASSVSVVDSCFATLINQLSLCKNRRFIHYVPRADEDNGARKDFHNLVLSSDWRIVK